MVNLDQLHDRNDFYFYTISNACHRLGLLVAVVATTGGNASLSGKKKWSNMVWECAWSLGDAYWNSISVFNPECTLLNRSLGNTRYLFLWTHSDNHPYDMKMCKTT